MKSRLAIAAALVIYLIAARLLPHPSNFAPLTALAIFAGSRLSRESAVLLSLVAAVVSDAAVGFYNAPTMVTVWLTYGLIALAANNWLKQVSLLRGAAVTFASSFGFFLITNFAVWLFDGMYVHSFRGFAECYYLALPFWRNSIAGDVFYTASLFGCYAMIQQFKRVGLKRYV